MVKKKKTHLPVWVGVRHTESIPGLGRSPGEGDRNTPQYSCLENPMDRGGHGPEGSQESDTAEVT